MSPTREEVQATLTAPGQIFEIIEETIGGVPLRVAEESLDELKKAAAST